MSQLIFSTRFLGRTPAPEVFASRGQSKPLACSPRLTVEKQHLVFKHRWTPNTLFFLKHLPRTQTKTTPHSPSSFEIHTIYDSGVTET